MTDEQSHIGAILANCILQKHREANEILGINWSEMCVIAAVGLAVDGGNPPNVSTISQMATLPLTTTARIVAKLTSKGWLTRIEKKPYPVYTRTTDPEKLERGIIFLNRFVSTIEATGCKLNIAKSKP